MLSISCDERSYLVAMAEPFYLWCNPLQGVGGLHTPLHWGVCGTLRFVTVTVFSTAWVCFSFAAVVHSSFLGRTFIFGEFLFHHMIIEILISGRKY